MEEEVTEGFGNRLGYLGILQREWYMSGLIIVLPCNNNAAHITFTLAKR